MANKRVPTLLQKMAGQAGKPPAPTQQQNKAASQPEAALQQPGLPAVERSNDRRMPEPVVESIIPLVNRSALVEIIVFLTAAVVLDFMFGNGTRFVNMPLHPFWIIVLLVTVQYGPIEALIAAALSSAVLLAGNLPEQSLNETMYEYILHVTLTPFLWVVAALVLGSIRARQREERKSLLNQLWKSEQAAAAIVENYKAAKLSKERLELRLAEERRSVLTVYELAKSLETFDPAEAMVGVERLVRTALNPKKFSFFRWTSNALDLDVAYGWEKTDAYEKRFHGNTPLASQVMKEKRVLSIIREEDEKLLNGQGMMAGPIIDEETGKIFGMLKIEETSFTDMGIRTYETFRAVCSWIARVCANVEKFQDATQGRPVASPMLRRGKKHRTPPSKPGSGETSNSAA